LRRHNGARGYNKRSIFKRGVELPRLLFRELRLSPERRREKYTDKIKQKRLEKNLTQEQLGIRAGLRPNHISMIETGRKVPTVKTLKKLANALDCTIDELID